MRNPQQMFRPIIPLHLLRVCYTQGMTPGVFSCCLVPFWFQPNTSKVVSQFPMFHGPCSLAVLPAWIWQQLKKSMPKFLINLLLLLGFPCTVGICCCNQNLLLFSAQSYFSSSCKIKNVKNIDRRHDIYVFLLKNKSILYFVLN